MELVSLKICFFVQRLLALLAGVVAATMTINLDGSPGSYVMYPPWKPCLNASLSFRFKTEGEHSLILYLEHDRDFLEMQLLRGCAQLRAKIGVGVVTIQTGEFLNDGTWHDVNVRQHDGLLSLRVDGVENSKQSTAALQNYGSSPSSDDVLFLGGLPMEYEGEKFVTLSLPSVVFEPRFRGSISHFFYQNCEGEIRKPRPLEFRGVSIQDANLCEMGNPCLNGGWCHTTHMGMLCDCSQTGHRGDRCELQNDKSEATFLGMQHFFYNLSSRGDVFLRDYDQITLDFRTKQASSLLFHTGNSEDYITAGLLNGAVFISVKLGSGMYEAEIRPSHIHFDDSRWHHLIILRNSTKVSMELDGLYKEHTFLAEKSTHLSNRALYVAGSPRVDSLPGSRVGTHFQGCLRNVLYQTDSIKLDLIELALTEKRLLHVVGEVSYGQCHEFSQSTSMVTFTTKESYLTIPTWDGTSGCGSLAFKFRTVEPNAVLMYSRGDSDSVDFFALELFDAHLYLLLDMGSGVQKIQASISPVTEGNTHNVYFEFTDSKGYISVDGHKQTFSSSKLSDRFDLSGLLYVGGLDPEINVALLPGKLWAVKLGLSYVGCLLDLIFNGHQVDLLEATTPQNKSGVEGYCKLLEPQCPSFPCRNQGKCIEGWNRFTCDCRATGFVGSECQTAAMTFRFNGSQFMKVNMATELITQADDISLRFQTMHPNGLLFLTTGHMGSNMVLYLEGGTLFLSANLGDGAKILSHGHTLNDNVWHTVFIKRRMHAIELTIDAEKSVTADLPGQNKELSILSVEIGRLSQSDGSNGDTHSGFIGSLQAFIYDGIDFFQMAKLNIGNNVKMSAYFSSDELEQKPVTFKSMDAYTILPQLQIHNKFSVTLQIKTIDNSGLILYNGGRGQDFFAMEIFDGFLHYVYDMGDGPRRVKVTTSEPINDNKWHQILLLRAETHKQLLRVDDNTPTIDDLSSFENSNLDLSGHLYVGGASKKMFPYLPKQIYSRQGFVGCLGSIDLNGYLPDLVLEATQIHGSVEYGCLGPLTKCANNSCANNGRCVQHWTSYKCDCDMTSFTGPACRDESVSYKFGSWLGLVSYFYPDMTQHSTVVDSLTFGLQTFQEEATLIRIESKSFNDFIQLELIRGHVYLTYNMGNFVHHLANFHQKVNDGHYHVVQFTRAGPNATLQVDSNVPQMKNSTGDLNHIFNNPAVITVGGKKANGSIIEHFEGLISGLVFNGIRLLELTKQNDPTIQVEGNVFLNIESSFTRSKDLYKDKDIDQMMAIEEDAGAEDEVIDDIIFVGDAQSCHYDNEEDCSTNGHGTDEIITPVVIIKTTTHLPTTTTEIQEPKCGDQECESVSKTPLTPDMTGSTSHTSRGSFLDRDGNPIRGENGDIYSSEHKINDDLKNYDSTEEPGKTVANKSKKEKKEINLGLILGISISVLVAVIVLGIALYKLRSRNEGIYKVDETQNFSSMQSPKPVGNGIIASASDSEQSCKRGRMKDVKEWYV